MHIAVSRARSGGSVDCVGQTRELFFLKTREALENRSVASVEFFFFSILCFVPLLENDKCSFSMLQRAQRTCVDLSVHK